MRKFMIFPIVLLTIFGVIALIQRNSQARDHSYITVAPLSFFPATTITTLPPPTTTTTIKKTPVTVQRTSRRENSPRQSSVPTGDFWARLRACESPTNSGTRYRGYYQFSQSSWKGAGGTGDPAAASLEEQTARAQYWAAHTDPKTQWPVCWRRAQG